MARAPPGMSVLPFSTTSETTSNSIFSPVVAVAEEILCRKRSSTGVHYLIVVPAMA
ncbi:hypothetical protein V3390_03560 [Luteimonas sp. FXH3W]|uniref:Uncharacterized protein n=1 Tax=Aquilutibacter rugosus TaxID=3115820 RepID=A0ABU7UY11_9GAMM